MISPSDNATAIFWKSIDEARATCTFPSVFNYEVALPNGLTIHQVFMITTGVAAALNIAIALYLLIGHLCHGTKPLIQKQGCRVIIFIIWLSVTTLLSAIFYNSSQYIIPVGELYEGFAITAVFLLYVRIIASTAPSRDAFFHELETKKGGSTAWFQRLFAFVFQIIVIRIVTLVAFEALAGATCSLSKHRTRGHTIITVIQSISTSVAVISIVIFEKRMKEHLRPWRSLWMLWAFKGVVILNILQSLVFAGLAEKNIWRPSAPYHMSYNDFVKGLPQVIFIWELFVAALVFVFAYAFKSHRAEIRGSAQVAAGPGAALISILSLGDIVQGSKYGFMGSEEALVKCIGGFHGQLSQPVSDENLKQ